MITIVPINKSEEIRKVFAQNPNATHKEVQQILEGRGLEVSYALVKNVIIKERSKGNGNGNGNKSKPKGKGIPHSERIVRRDQISLNAVLKAKEFSDALGGTQKAIDLLSEFKDIKTAKASLRALSDLVD